MTTTCRWERIDAPVVSKRSVTTYELLATVGVVQERTEEEEARLILIARFSFHLKKLFFRMRKSDAASVLRHLVLHVPAKLASAVP